VSIRVACPDCGTPNETEASFCSLCGLPLTATPQVAVVTQPEAQPEDQNETTQSQVEQSSLPALPEKAEPETVGRGWLLWPIKRIYHLYGHGKGLGSNRLEYIQGVLFLIAASLATATIELFLATYELNAERGSIAAAQHPLFAAITCLYYASLIASLLLIFIPYLTITVRRLHDAGLTGWLTIPYLFFGSILSVIESNLGVSGKLVLLTSFIATPISIAVLASLPSKRDPNKYLYLDTAGGPDLVVTQRVSEAMLHNSRTNPNPERSKVFLITAVSAVVLLSFTLLLALAYFFASVLSGI